MEQSAYYHAAPLLKVSTLQYWLGKPYTDGYLTKGLEGLPHCARLFLFQSNETSENIEAKSAEVPNSAASDSQKFFSNTFKADKEVQNIELDLEIFMRDVEKEVKALSVFIRENNYANLKKVTSTKHFWLSNANKYPILFQLALIMLNINSSSACIERYFSICGFNSRKDSGNTHDDLFISRCMLRANVKTLIELNNISY